MSKVLKFLDLSSLWHRLNKSPKMILIGIEIVAFRICTLPETNIFAPENCWLEDFLLSFWDPAYFQGLLLLVLGMVYQKKMTGSWIWLLIPTNSKNWCSWAFVSWFWRRVGRNLCRDRLVFFFFQTCEGLLLSITTQRSRYELFPWKKLTLEVATG